MRIWLAVLSITLAIAVSFSTFELVRADEVSKPLKLQLTLRERVDVNSNYVKLADICEMEGSESLIQSLRDVPIGPSPRDGGTSTWTREEIDKLLQLRGVGPNTIRWRGANDAKVSRDLANDVAKASYVSKAQPIANGFSKQNTALDKSSRAPNANSSSSNPKLIDKTNFTPAFATPTMATQADGNVALAIERYLQMKTKSNTRWIVKPEIGTENSGAFMQRASILNVGGGLPPWEGRQEFIFVVKAAGGERVINVFADVKLPDMVIASKGPLAKGRVLRDDDLVWVAVPANANYASSECCSEWNAVVGKQLRKAFSSQQPIKMSDVSEPMIVQAGDSITLGVVSGAILVETKAKAIESGAMDDIIQIETLHDKKRRSARVVGDRKVEIISNSISKLGG